MLFHTREIITKPRQSAAESSATFHAIEKVFHNPPHTQSEDIVRTIMLKNDFTCILRLVPPRPEDNVLDVSSDATGKCSETRPSQTAILHDSPTPQ